MVALSFILFILTCIGIDALIQYTRRKKSQIHDISTQSPKVFDETLINIPRGIYFDKSHTWAYMDKYGNVKIGIDDFLQHILGEITDIKTKKGGEMIKKGEEAFTLVQRGKHLSIKSPVSGKIKSQNPQLKLNSSIISSSPYTDGWIYEIEPSDWIKEIQFMKMAEKASDWIKNEFTRFKDFLTTLVNSKDHKYENMVFQDGGTIRDNVLTEYGPEIWEEFQIQFIDKA